MYLQIISGQCDIIAGFVLRSASVLKKLFYVIDLRTKEHSWDHYAKPALLNL